MFPCIIRLFVTRTNHHRNSSLPVANVIHNCMLPIVFCFTITNSSRCSASNANHTPFLRNGYAAAISHGICVRLTHLWGIGVVVGALKGKHPPARLLSGAFRMLMPYQVTRIFPNPCVVSGSKVTNAPLIRHPSRREPYRRWWNGCISASRATNQHLPLLPMLLRRVALSPPSARLNKKHQIAREGEG